MLNLYDDGPVKRVTMARTAFGRPLFTVESYVVDDWLEVVCDKVLGPEGWMTTFTRGHFSKLNLLRSLAGS
jgi:hypothetical protein